jgi:antitoxin YefM
MRCEFVAMKIASLKGFRQNMNAYFEKVFNLKTSLFISRPKGQDMVINSKEEYDGMLETYHLLKSPKNTERLLAAVEADKMATLSH